MTKNETSYTTIFHHNRPQLQIKKIRRTSYFRHKLRTRESKYLFSNREEDVVNDSLNDTREAKPNENTWQSIVKQRCGAQIMQQAQEEAKLILARQITRSQ